MLLRTRREAVAPDAAHQPSTRPFYNVRAVQVALGAAAAIVLAFTLFNVVQIVRLSSASRRSARRRPRPSRKRRGCGPRRRGSARRSTRGTGGRGGRGARGERHHRPARVLVDRALRAVRGDAARRRPHHGGPAAAGARAPSSWRSASRRGGRRISTRSSRRSRTTGAFRDVLAVKEQTGEDGLIEAIVEGDRTCRAARRRTHAGAGTEGAGR